MRYRISRWRRRTLKGVIWQAKERSSFCPLQSSFRAIRPCRMEITLFVTGGGRGERVLFLSPRGSAAPIGTACSARTGVAFIPVDPFSFPPALPFLGQSSPSSLSSLAICKLFLQGRRGYKWAAENSRQTKRFLGIMTRGK